MKASSCRSPWARVARGGHAAARVWTSHRRIRLSPRAFAAFLTVAVQPVSANDAEASGHAHMLSYFCLNCISDQMRHLCTLSLVSPRQPSDRPRRGLMSVKKNIYPRIDPCSMENGTSSPKKADMCVANAAASARGSHRLPDERRMGLR